MGPADNVRTTCTRSLLLLRLVVIVAGQYAELRAQPPPDLLAGIEGRWQQEYVGKGRNGWDWRGGADGEGWRRTMTGTAIHPSPDLLSLRLLSHSCAYMLLYRFITDVFARHFRTGRVPRTYHWVEIVGQMYRRLLSPRRPLSTHAVWPSPSTASWRRAPRTMTSAERVLTSPQATGRHDGRPRDIVAGASRMRLLPARPGTRCRRLTHLEEIPDTGKNFQLAFLPLSPLLP